MGHVKHHPNKRFNHYEIIADPSGAFVLVELTQGQWSQCEIDDWFGFLSQHKWCAAWDSATKTYYAKTKVRKLDGRVLCVNMNRMIFGEIPNTQISDHKDRDTLNNRRRNLRLATANHSACNRRRFSNNSSRFKGVSFLKTECRWLAYINLDRKRIRIGKFPDPQSAAAARDAASIQIHGEYAVLNFPKGEVS